MYDDTIAAIATPPGEGGIGLVRLSGSEAGRIAAAIFRRGARGRAVTPAQLTSHQLFYGVIVDPVDGRALDEVMLVRMSPPRTYTRDEVVEISCHGGVVPVREVLALCLRAGARLAEPGEFTLRAFLNGRIDLAQAEAVAGIVSARTTRSLGLALDELRGQLTARLRPARDTLVETLAYLDAAADFPDDEIPSINLAPALASARSALTAVVAAGQSGLLYREGIQIAIIGRPNVGKSSVLNALLRAERAIVTPIAGTTRDVIAEGFNLRGVPATLLDTAGINDSEDVIERMGVERSRRAMATSGIALFVLDRSRPPGVDDLTVARLLAERVTEGNLLVALNKSDLAPVDQHPVLDLLPRVPTIALSTRTGAGLDALEAALHDLAVNHAADAAEPALVTVRQLDALRRALEHVIAAQDAYDCGIPLDVLAVDVRAALYAVGEITGERVSDAVLDEIFRRFCIGK